MDFNLKNIPSKKGKIAILTGCKQRYRFRDYVKAGGKVIMGCRSQKRATKAKGTIHSRVPDADLDS